MNSDNVLVAIFFIVTVFVVLGIAGYTTHYYSLKHAQSICKVEKVQPKEIKVTIP